MIEERIRRELLVRRYSPRTEKAYMGWVRRLVPATVPGPSPSSASRKWMPSDPHRGDPARQSGDPNQAASALALAFETLGRPLPRDARSLVRARQAHHLPEVLSRAEARRVLRELSGRKRLGAALLYGSGLRLNEALHLRVTDVRIELNEIVVRQGKGPKDRVTMIPDRLRDPLARQIARRRRLHEEDLTRGAGWIPLPDALDRKGPPSQP